MSRAPHAHAPDETDAASSLLDPPLPYRMHDRLERAARDLQLQQFVANATRSKLDGRIEACRAAFGDRYDELRLLAGRIKQHTLDHLDHYLDRFVERAAAAGTTVHFATDAAEANAIVLAIAQRRGARLCVKSKSMVTEETRLVPALEAAGVETVETDLGEFIVQLDHDAPSHIVTPMIHKDRTAVARAFVRELGAEYTEDPSRLTMIAREHMRGLYRRADLGISGANFLVADSGALVICTNEGNADLCVGTPPVHIAVVGIEKLVPSLTELPVFLKLLARSATAQPLTIYTTLVAGPRRPEERDGPEEMHVVLVDNGRIELLRPETRELLRCIRCGACLNACPVYRKAGGGHAYGAVYSGPIGAVITPLLKGLENYPDLPQASSLCGACARACPVAIDIPHHLVRLRGELVRRRIEGPLARLVYATWNAALHRPWSYALA
ncbi:MAG: lactate utilization protein, partial [Phycisphaerales bacterium]|nr:lactate utilization protein [Phycisphaerales bacterium]